MKNLISNRSEIRDGMVIELESATLLVTQHDVTNELICVNTKIHKCTGLGHLLDEDLSVSKHYISNLICIKNAQGAVIYKPVVKLTLKQIAEKFGYNVDQICIIDDKS